MKKEEIINTYGEEEYERRLQRRREWYAQHRKESKAKSKEWAEKHPEEDIARHKKWAKNNSEKVIANSQEQCRKGGKRYNHALEYQTTGLRRERTIIRRRHRRLYYPYKSIVALDTQLHHQWYPDTANYRGIALVEKDQHMYGFIDVIQILEGEITLLSEAEIMEAK